MKTFSILLCAGLVIAAGAASAATAGGMRHGQGMRMKQGQRQGPGPMQQLGLSDEQKAQLEALRTEFQQQQQELRAQIEAGTLSREDGLAQMKTAAEAHRTALDKILTDEQRQKLAEWKQNHPAGPGMGKAWGGPGMMGKGRGPGVGRAGGPGLEKLATELGLSEEQKAQWQELVKKQRAQMEQLRQSGQRPDPATMRQLFAEHQKAVEALLTPEQLQKLGTLRKNWREPQPAPGSASKPAAPAEQTWGQIKSQGK